MALILNKPLVFVGMMGAGKTAVGKAVAQVLNVPFLDSDSELEKAANLTIPEIFERHGEAFFPQERNASHHPLAWQPIMRSFNRRRSVYF